MRNIKAKLLRLKSTEQKEMGTGLKLHQGSFRLGIRKNSCAEQGSGTGPAPRAGGEDWWILSIPGGLNRCGFEVALAVLG